MNAARLGDVWSGQCCCHPPAPCIGMSGIIISGSNNVLVNGMPAARMTDIVVGDCGHSGIIITGSNTVFTNNLQKARLSDSVTGCTIGTIVVGSSDVMVY